MLDVDSLAVLDDGGLLHVLDLLLDLLDGADDGLAVVLLVDLRERSVECVFLQSSPVHPNYKSNGGGLSVTDGGRRRTSLYLI